MSITSEVLYEVSKPVRRHLLPILRESIGICVERHQLAEGKGADNFSFYTDAWSLPARRFKDCIAEQTIPFTQENLLGCVLHYEQYQVRHHCVGWSEQDDIWDSFPKNANALSSEMKHQDQMLLDFGEDLSPQAGSGTLVLAYMANPIEGLCSVYMATPKRVQKGRIVEWDKVTELWRREPVADESTDEQPAEDQKLSVSDTMTDKKHPAEESPIPVVRRRRNAVKKAVK